MRAKKRFPDFNNENRTCKSKKVQRKMNALVRALNKSIEADDLWRGRFVVWQWNRQCRRWEDGSGVNWDAQFILYDKKTKIWKKTSYYSNYGLFYDLAKEMNDFIIYTVDVWRKEKPREEIIDYTDVPIDRTGVGVYA